jgi:hypothetical protein
VSSKAGKRKEDLTPLKSELVDIKQLYDTCVQAIQIAHANGYTEKQLKSIMVLKQNTKYTLDVAIDRLQTAMHLNNNIQELKDGWHAIRYIDGRSKLSLRLSIVHAHGLRRMQRDGRYEAELTAIDLGTLLEDYGDSMAMEEYMEQCIRDAPELLKEHGITSDSQGDSDEQCEDIYVAGVSKHAAKRWAQRVMGMSVIESDYYVRDHYSELVKVVMAGYASAELVWTGLDKTEYWFDADNIMYVLTSGTIVTLYEMDFGFNKDINRMITQNQLDVLRNSHRGIADAVRQADAQAIEINGELSTIDADINLLQSKIDLLATRKSTLTSQLNENSRAAIVARQTYNAEFSKLFTKWES